MFVFMIYLSLLVSLLYEIHPGVRTIFVFMIYLLSFTLSPIGDPSRCSHYLCVHDLSFLSLCLSCLYRLSAFVFLEIYIHSFTLVVCFGEDRIITLVHWPDVSINPTSSRRFDKQGKSTQQHTPVFQF
jgi:hypothetical protein